MQTKWYQIVVSVLRIILTILILGNIVQSVMKMDNQELIFSIVLSLYALVFSVLKPTKWKSIIELVIVIGFIMVYPDSNVSMLLLVPFIIFASRNNKRIYILMFSGIVGTFFYLKTFMMIESIVATSILFFILYSFFENFRLLEKLENDLFLQKEKTNQMEKEIAKQNSEMKRISTMLEKSTELIDSKTKEEIIQMMMNASKEFFDSYYIAFYQRKKNLYVRTNELGQNNKYEVEEAIPETEVNGHTMKDDMIEIDMRHFDRKWGLLRIYGKRIEIGKKKNKHFVPFEEFDLEIILIYASQVMVRIQDVELAKKNEFMATHDMLTEIPNRNFFLKMFEQLVKDTERGAEFSLVIVDIDHFKIFNDTYGHERGDQVLKIVAETLVDSVRNTDFVGRIGGEEFAILLKNPKGNSYEIANKVRRNVSVIPTETRKITVSMGIAEYGKDGISWTELYNNADSALYYAKENGRNQVVMYEPHMS